MPDGMAGVARLHSGLPAANLVVATPVVQIMNDF